MKKFLFTILILSFCVSGIYAQSESNTKRDNEFYCKALKQYLVCLNHDNDGVVESSIIILMKMRRECPDMAFQTTINRLDSVAMNGRTKSIRLLASVAARYLQDSENPGHFSDIKQEDHKQLITMLLDRLE